MDTKDFLLKRQAILERLDERRSRDPSAYPFQMGSIFGMKFPFWLKWGLSFATRGGVLSRLLQVGLTIAAPLVLKKQLPFLSRLLSRFSSSEA
jgi:hypothetical protein